MAGMLERVAWRLRGADSYRTPWPVEPIYRSLNLPLRREKATRSGSLVFVLPRAHSGSGGLLDVVRIGEALRIGYGIETYYLLDDEDDLNHARSQLHALDAAIPASHILSELRFVPSFLCATAWRTAYRGLTMPAEDYIYLAQDYEPDFHPSGVERYYATQTYRLGFRTFAVGPWLADMINREVAPAIPAQALPFPLVSDPCVSRGDRTIIAFSVQPEKKHRGNELLWEVARCLYGRTGFETAQFVFFGSKWNLYKEPDFPCRQESSLIGEDLENLLQHTRVGVSASFSNISLTPVHMIAKGVRVVEVDLPNVRKNVPEIVFERMELAAPSAEALAAAVERAWLAPRDDDAALRVAESLSATNGWPAVVRRFAELIGK